MRNPLIVCALCATSIWPASHVVFAQVSPTAREHGAKTLDESGYELFLEARALTRFGSIDEQLSPDRPLLPAEELRLDRLFTARNAPALAHARAALAVGITPPFPGDDEENRSSRDGDSARVLAHLFAWEAAVRAADGDALGAARSGLDALRLGAQMGYGTFANEELGFSINAIARESLIRHAALLDSAQSREVARQTDEITGQMQTRAQVLRAQQKFDARKIVQRFADFNDPTKRQRMEINLEDEARAMLQLPLSDVLAGYNALFDRAVARAAQPYFAESRAERLRSAISYLDWNGTDVFSRFLLEREILSNRLFADALRVQAIKRETGKYPAQFNASADPFSPALAPLIYRRTNDSYLLYSVGPNGIDDNGLAIQGPITSAQMYEEGHEDRTVTRVTGDILAPVL